MADIKFEIEKIVVTARSRTLTAKWGLNTSGFIPMPRKIIWMFIDMNELRPNANSAHPFGLNGSNVDGNSFLVMQKFCRDSFGPSDKEDPNRRWISVDGGADGMSCYFAFRTETDRALFFFRFSDGC